MTRKPIALAVPLLLALTAACGGGSSAAERGQSGGGAADTPTTTSPVAVGTYPLTGMPSFNPANLARRAVAVKIDNAAASRPQSGLDAADVIYEEFTEGITRFVVVFHSTDAPQVGPVRSVRPADPNIVKPFGGPFAFSGGSAPVLDVVRSSGLTQITENNKDVLRRRSGKRAPHNLYSTAADLFRKAGAGSAPPALSTFLRQGQPFAPAGATSATSLTLQPAPGVRAAYAWDPAASVWRRSTDGRPHTVEGGAQISPRNVIVQYTSYVTFGPDPKVRFPEVVGSGDALVLSGGKQVKAKWTKSAPGAVTSFTDSAGAPIPLAPGQTWIHLQERGSAVTAA
jgi:hypothetical protein